MGIKLLGEASKAGRDGTEIGVTDVTRRGANRLQRR